MKARIVLMLALIALVGGLAGAPDALAQASGGGGSGGSGGGDSGGADGGNENYRERKERERAERTDPDGADLLLLAPRADDGTGRPGVGYCGFFSGATQTLSLVVSNRGSTPTDATTVLVSFSETDPALQFSIALDGIAENESTTLDVPIPAGAWRQGDGKYAQFSIVVDPDNLVLERSLGNNSASGICLGWN